MANLKIGIVGLPNVGKSTLFNALTKNQVLAANYPFATIDPNVGVVPVPDKRLDKLAAIFHPERVIPATVDFVDIAGLVRGAHKGEGLGNQFLAHILEASAICQVVRAFHDPNVTHVAGQVDPEDDIETIRTELALADLQTLAKRTTKMESDVKKDPQLAPALRALQSAQAALSSAGQLPAEPIENLPNDLNLLSSKPLIYVLNLDEQDLTNQDLKNKLSALAKPSPALFVSAKVEAELKDVNAEEAAELLRSLGQTESGLDQLVATAYRTLNLITYLTAGPKEVRAWTIHLGDSAPTAAGVIHTDFQKGFIRAEVVKFEDLLSAGSYSEAKALGQVRSEGKDYIMQDGDVVEFRFNV